MNHSFSFSSDELCFYRAGGFLSMIDDDCLTYQTIGHLRIFMFVLCIVGVCSFGILTLRLSLVLVHVFCELKLRVRVSKLSSDSLSLCGTIVCLPPIQLCHFLFAHKWQHLETRLCRVFDFFVLFLQLF